jgi:hypothetical protein
MVEIDDWSRLWKDAKTELFRLQLLNTYLVEDEAPAFEAYKKGKFIAMPSFDSWLEQLQEKKNAGVKIVNLLVVDMPLSEYTRFGIEMCYFATATKGQETFIVERKDVAHLLDGAVDFWMFDRKAAIPMKYDKEGHWLGTEDTVTDANGIAKLNNIRDRVLEHALPLEEFLKVHRLSLVDKKPKKVATHS